MSRKILTRKYRNVNEMFDDGWTRQEIDELVKAPRTRPAEASDTYFRWPEIDGINVTGLYSVLTAEEKAQYQNYRKQTRRDGCTSGRIMTNRPSQKLDPELMAKWERLLEACSNDETAKNLVLDLMPKTSEEIMLKQFTGLNKADVTNGKTAELSIHYLMFRSPDGEFAENKLIDAKDVAKLFVKGWMPKFTIDECLSKLQQLSTYGFSLKLHNNI